MPADSGATPGPSGASTQHEDDLGFRLPPAGLTPAQQQQRISAHQAAESTSKKWEQLSRQKTQLPSRRSLKRLIRKGGVPLQHRGWAWSELSGASALRASKPATYFRDLIAAADSKSSAVRQIQLDLPRTFPEHAWLRSEGGQAALSDVLTAFSVHHPAVGYCQGLNFVSALLLVSTGREPETAFWLLAVLVSQIVYHDTYAPDLPGFQVEMRTLASLVKWKLPKLHKHLESISCDIHILATDWFLTLYSTSLPPETALRVWDSLFLEGPKILFRTALALLQLNQPLLLNHDNAGEALRSLKQATTGLYAAHKLMARAFDKIGGLPMARIQGLRQQQQAAVDKELEARRLERQRRELEDAQRAEQRRREQALQQAQNGVGHVTPVNGTASNLTQLGETALSAAREGLTAAAAAATAVLQQVSVPASGSARG